MSTNSTSEDRIEDGHGTSARGELEGMQNTTVADTAIAVKVFTPSTVTEEAAPQPTLAFNNDYFSTHPSASEQRAQSVISGTTSPTPSVSASDVTATGQFKAPDTAGRPVPHATASSYSIQSIDSAATVTVANPASIIGETDRSRPEYPNQSYAALHDQQHPPPYPAPTLKQRSSNPDKILTSTPALASLHSSGSRTVGNSPAVTPGPGLYSPQTASELPSEWESPGTPGTYASPYLHFTHRAQPKETHVADVDVDPVSGRKMINHYEILDELGRGTHGKVKLGRDLTNTNTDNNCVAIKIVERFSKRRKLGKLGTTEDKVKKEVAILKQARHPNVVALLEVIDDPSRKKVYIVLEWVERGEIKWRTHGPREICMVEARRYEREKAGRFDHQSKAEDAAIFAEAQKRLVKEKRRQHRTFRHVRQEGADEAGIWSHEMAGDDVSDISDDEKLSRVSSDSFGGKLLFDDTRRASRAPSPLPPQAEEVATPITETTPQYLSLTSEPQTDSPTTNRQDFGDFNFTGLEGTMYGAYVPSSYGDSRLPSGSNSVHSLHSRPPSKSSSGDLSQMAAEVLSTDLHEDLDYVPVMTMQQIRVAFRDTLLGLQYLHFQGIIHRDIKPPNLLATLDHRVKISDFGVSYLGRPLHEGEAGEDVSEHEAQDLEDDVKELAKTVGTPAFYAPELCITDPMDDPPPITKAIDVWALGVTLFCMLFARTPYVDNEYVVMRRICDEEIYLPKKRVRPVDARPRSRPSSHGRAFPPQAHGRRNELDFIYEDLGEELHDLLRRLLIKDPKQRITLQEVRHHPWVLADLHDKLAWLEETDPSRQSQGKKIEVSKEDMNAAVVPLFLDRVKLGIKKVGERLGFGGGTGRSTGRGRAHSHVGPSNGGSPSPPNASSSTNISREERRQSLRGDESSMIGFKTAKEGEHPLSKSVAASPELDKQNSFFSDMAVQPESDLVGSELIESTPSRSSPLERAKTVMSTTGSMRTVRQADFRRSGYDESPPPSPGLPETPTALDSTNNFPSGWGGRLAQRVMKTVRERSTARSADGRASSSERGSVESMDAHGEPSVAVSPMTAAGLVHVPTTFDDFPMSSAPSSARNSPPASRPLSLTSSPSRDRLSPSAAEPASLSRVSSAASVSSIGRRAVLHHSHFNKSPVQAQSHIPPESSQEDWKRAEDEHIRKLVREREDANRPLPNPFDNRTCPPSPDDQQPRRDESRRVSVLDISNPGSSYEASPTGQNPHFQPPMLSSTSDFGSAVSISMSNPSIPSVISEASSIDPRDVMTMQEEEEKTDIMSSGETVDAKSQTQEEATDDGYTADDQDMAINSDDDYYDSSDSDGGLVMTRRKSAAKAANATVGDSLPDMKDTGLSARSKKSSRSGSSNTMKKIRTRGSGDERRRPS